MVPRAAADYVQQLKRFLAPLKEMVPVKNGWQISYLNNIVIAIQVSHGLNILVRISLWLE